jgi:putative oxidoreductase
MFEQATSGEPRNPLGDWMIRGSLALIFVMIGADKFPSGAGTPWVKMFDQIGLGQWFRYFTGVVELLGGALLLIPRTLFVGLALLECAMGGAALVWIFVLHQPFNSVIPGGILVGLGLFGWSRWNR